jgi:hypothetical protein
MTFGNGGANEEAKVAIFWGCQTRQYCVDATNGYDGMFGLRVSRRSRGHRIDFAVDSNRSAF